MLNSCHHLFLPHKQVECGSGGGGEGGVPKVCGVEGEHTEVLLLPLPSLHTTLEGEGGVVT